MNLEQTIAELEQQAAQYTQAADALRALLGREASTPKKRGRKPGSKVAAKKAGKKRRKRGPVSEATRAKIAAGIKKSHAARKARGAK